MWLMLGAGLVQSLRGRLLSSVSFEFNEPLEYIRSMYHAANVETIKKLVREYALESEGESVELVADLRARLSPHLKRELDCFLRYPEGNDTRQAPLLLLALEHPSLKSIPDLLALVEETDPRILLGCLARTVYDGKLPAGFDEVIWDGDVNDGCKQLSKLLQQATDNINPLVNEFLEWLAYPDETKQRLLYVFTGFYEQSYQLARDQILSLACTPVPRYSELFQRDPIDFFANVIQADPNTLTKLVKIHISPLPLASAIMIRPNDEPDWVIIDANRDQYFGLDAQRRTIEALFKALSDKTRLEIVYRLAHRRWYGQELAESLGISSAAVSNHLNYFYHLHVFHVEREGHRYYYALNKERLLELLDLAKRVIVSERRA